VLASFDGRRRACDAVADDDEICFGVPGDLVGIGNDARSLDARMPVGIVRLYRAPRAAARLAAVLMG